MAFRSSEYLQRYELTFDFNLTMLFELLLILNIRPKGGYKFTINDQVYSFYDWYNAYFEMQIPDCNKIADGTAYVDADQNC